MVKRRTRAKSAAGRGKWLVAALVILALGVGVYLAFGSTIASYTSAGTSYTARVACSCRYIGERSLDSCATDKIAGMDIVRLSENSASRSVTATIPLFRSDTAYYREGYGCVLERWEG